MASAGGGGSTWRECLAKNNIAPLAAYRPAPLRDGEEPDTALMPPLELSVLLISAISIEARLTVRHAIDRSNPRFAAELHLCCRPLDSGAR